MIVHPWWSHWRHCSLPFSQCTRTIFFTTFVNSKLPIFTNNFFRVGFHSSFRYISYPSHLLTPSDFELYTLMNSQDEDHTSSLINSLEELCGDDDKFFTVNHGDQSIFHSNLYGNNQTTSTSSSHFGFSLNLSVLQRPGGCSGGMGISQDFLRSRGR
jgi:hypothetical protein